MSSSIENPVYSCVAKGNRIICSYNTGDHELERLAALCLENSPPFHTWYFHTVGKRTFGFLMEDGYTYFAIVNSSMGNLGTLRFLEHIRDRFKKVAKNGFQEELVLIIQRLKSSLESLSQPAFATDQMSEGTLSSDGPTSTHAPLLGKNISKNDRKKMKDRTVEARDLNGDHTERGIKIDVPSEAGTTISLQKSSSSTRARGQQIARKRWWRHVKLIIAIDVLLCLVLFGIWLAVCRGFECVSNR